MMYRSETIFYNNLPKKHKLVSSRSYESLPLLNKTNKKQQRKHLQNNFHTVKNSGHEHKPTKKQLHLLY